MFITRYVGSLRAKNTVLQVLLVFAPIQYILSLTQGYSFMINSQKVIILKGKCFSALRPQASPNVLQERPTVGKGSVTFVEEPVQQPIINRPPARPTAPPVR